MAVNSIRFSRMRSFPWSYSYLLRDPLGISTITSTSMDTPSSRVSRRDGRREAAVRLLGARAAAEGDIDRPAVLRQAEAGGAPRNRRPRRQVLVDRRECGQGAGARVDGRDSTVGLVTLAAPGGELPAYVATPPGAGPWPGVVVLHDLVGMSADLHKQANWLAEAGYLAVAPDLFRGNRRAVCMLRMIRETVRRQGPTFADIEAVAGWVADRRDCTGKVGAIGFCLGAGFALLMAADHRFDAASVNYGPVSSKAYTEDAFAGACPIVGSYGAKDPGNRGAGERLERILSAVGVPHDITTYPQAGHSFMNDHDRTELPFLLALQFRVSGNPFHAPSDEDARRRILEFFSRHLRR